MTPENEYFDKLDAAEEAIGKAEECLENGHYLQGFGSLKGCPLEYLKSENPSLFVQAQLAAAKNLICMSAIDTGLGIVDGSSSDFRKEAIKRLKDSTQVMHLLSKDDELPFQSCPESLGIEDDYREPLDVDTASDVTYYLAYALYLDDQIDECAKLVDETIALNVLSPFSTNIGALRALKVQMELDAGKFSSALDELTKIPKDSFFDPGNTFVESHFLVGPNPIFQLAEFEPKDMDPVDQHRYMRFVMSWRLDFLESEFTVPIATILMKTGELYLHDRRNIDALVAYSDAYGIEKKKKSIWNPRLGVGYTYALLLNGQDEGEAVKIAQLTLNRFDRYVLSSDQSPDRVLEQLIDFVGYKIAPEVRESFLPKVRSLFAR